MTTVDIERPSESKKIVDDRATPPDILYYEELMNSEQFKVLKKSFRDAQIRSTLFVAILLIGVASVFSTLYFLHERGFFSEILNHRPYPDVDAAVRDLKPAMDQLIQIDDARDLTKNLLPKADEGLNFTTTLLESLIKDNSINERRLLAILSRLDTFRWINHKSGSGTANKNMVQIDSYETTQNNTRNTALRVMTYGIDISRYGTILNQNNDMIFLLPQGLNRMEAWLKISPEERIEIASKLRDAFALLKKTASDAAPLLQEGEATMKKQIDNMIGRTSIPSEVFIVAVANKTIVSLSLFAIIATFVTLIMREFRGINVRTAGILSFMLAASGAQRADPNTLRALSKVIGSSEPDAKSSSAWSPSQAVGTWISETLDRTAHIPGKEPPKT